MGIPSSQIGSDATVKALYTISKQLDQMIHLLGHLITTTTTTTAVP